MHILIKILFALLPMAAAHPPSIKKVLSEATESCRGIDGGQLEIATEAIQTMDLNGDGRMDFIVDYTKIVCSTAASLYSGSAGTLLEIFLTDQKGDLQLAWNANVFSFKIKHSSDKKQLYIDAKGDGINVVPAIYEAKGIQFVRIKSKKK